MQPGVPLPLPLPRFDHHPVGRMLAPSRIPPGQGVVDAAIRPSLGRVLVPSATAFTPDRIGRDGMSRSAGRGRARHDSPTEWSKIGRHTGGLVLRGSRRSTTVVSAGFPGVVRRGRILTTTPHFVTTHGSGSPDDARLANAGTTSTWRRRSRSSFTRRFASPTPPTSRPRSTWLATRADCSAASGCGTKPGSFEMRCGRHQVRGPHPGSLSRLANTRTTSATRRRGRSAPCGAALRRAAAVRQRRGGVDDGGVRERLGEVAQQSLAPRRRTRRSPTSSGITRPRSPSGSRSAARQRGSRCRTSGGS